MMSQKLSNSKAVEASTKNKKKPEPHINIFHDLQKRGSILLKLFDTKTKEVINHCEQAPSPSKDYCQLVLNFDKVNFI